MKLSERHANVYGQALVTPLHADQVYAAISAFRLGNTAWLLMCRPVGFPLGLLVNTDLGQGVSGWVRVSLCNGLKPVRVCCLGTK